MTEEIVERIRELDDLTALRLFRHVGPMLFKDHDTRRLVDAFPPSTGPLATLKNLSASQKQEMLSSERSILLARALLTALASHPRFEEVLVKALKSLRGDELVLEASVPRGLATDLVRLLASAREAESAWATHAHLSRDEATGREPARDALVDLAQVALYPEDTAVSSRGPRVSRPARVPRPARCRTVDATRIHRAPPKVRRLIADARAGNRFRRKTLLPDADHELLVRIAVPKKGETAAQLDFPDAALPPDESVELMVHVTSAAVGLLASQPIVLSTADRAAPSTLALFRFHTKGEGSVVDIKILVTYLERPLQEAHYVATVRSRSVPGDRVRLTAVPLSSWPEPRENTTPAQVSLDVHGANLNRIGSDRAVDLAQLWPLLEQIEGQASKVLASDDAPETLDDTAAIELLVRLARKGADLKGMLTPLGIGDAPTVSLLVDATTPVLPLELAYDAPTPEIGAKLCEHRVGGTKVGSAEACPNAGEKIVCPFAFWGQRRVIARTIRVDGKPVARDAIAPLSLRPVLYAATKRADEDVGDAVKPSDFLAAELTRLVGADDLTQVKTWSAWKKAVKRSHPQLMVVLGHTETAGDETLLEIGTGSFLRSPDVNAKYLSSEHSPPPLVVLLACSTAVPRNCFGGLTAAFTRRGAAAVVATLTKMHGPHGARAAAAVIGALREHSSAGGENLGTAMKAARAQLIREGLLVGLLLVAHGEIDLPLVH